MVLLVFSITPLLTPEQFYTQQQSDAVNRNLTMPFPCWNRPMSSHGNWNKKTQPPPRAACPLLSPGPPSSPHCPNSTNKPGSLHQSQGLCTCYAHSLEALLSTICTTCFLWILKTLCIRHLLRAGPWHLCPSLFLITICNCFTCLFTC